jgi:hypothetical protein
MSSLSEAKDDIDSVWASHKETFLKSLKESQGKTFKLTKENMGMIKSMIKEMVTATMVARTDKPTIDKLKQEKKPFELY